MDSGFSGSRAKSDTCHSHSRPAAWNAPSDNAQLQGSREERTGVQQAFRSQPESGGQVLFSPSFPQKENPPGPQHRTPSPPAPGPSPKEQTLWQMRSRLCTGAAVTPLGPEDSHSTTDVSKLLPKGPESECVRPVDHRSQLQ